MGRPAELYARDLNLGKRFGSSCGPAEDAYTNVDDVIACYHYLNKLGNIMCTTDYRTIMCKAGKAHIRGNALHGSTSSYW